MSEIAQQPDIRSLSRKQVMAAIVHHAKKLNLHPSLVTAEFLWFRDHPAGLVAYVDDDGILSAYHDHRRR